MPLSRRLLLAALSLAPAAARAQEWPARPLWLVVPFAPGGASDLLARLLAERLAPLLGQPVVVDNRPGAGATVGANAVARAAADGYTLLYGTPGPQIVNPTLMPSLPYDAEKDFSPVVSLIRAPNILVVHPSVPARSVAELIALAKAQPGRLSFGSSGIGASSHLAGEMLKHMAGIDITHVPFRGSGPALQELLAGNISMTLDTLTLVLGHVGNGALRPLAVTTPQRAAVMPDLPALAETLPGFNASALNYLTAPAGTPPAIIARLNGLVNGLLQDTAFRQRLVEQGFEPTGGTPEALAQQITAEAAQWRQVIRAANIRVE